MQNNQKYSKNGTENRYFTIFGKLNVGLSNGYCSHMMYLACVTRIYACLIGTMPRSGEIGWSGSKCLIFQLEIFPEPLAYPDFFLCG